MHRSATLFFAGCSDEQMLFAFDHVVLLTAPATVITARLRDRAGNPYGKDPRELARVLDQVATVEPVLRRAAGPVVDTDRPPDDVVTAVLRHVGDPHELGDGVVRLRPWRDDDAAWYAACVRDPEIQRFTTDLATLDAAQVLAAIERMRRSAREAGFVVCDAAGGGRLGNIALSHDGRVGEVSYWLAAEARGRGAATRALVLFTAWAFRELGLARVRLRAHRDNAASQRVALRAGYRRDPERDGPQEAKGTVWPMLGYVRDRPW